MLSLSPQKTDRVQLSQPIQNLDETEEVMGKENVVFGDPIVGKEATTISEDGPGAIAAKGLPSPPSMTPAQKATHDLTHLPYHPACEECVSTRRPNSHHQRVRDDTRTIPLLVGDYGFPRDHRDQECSTVLVLKLYPHKILFSCVVASKGPDPLVVGRLVKFIKDTGLMHFAYRSDKEPSIIALIEEACSRAGRRGVPATEVEDEVVLEDGDHASGELQPDVSPVAVESSQIGVPEHSHPGESASNGKAERAVQAVVDHIRTLKAAFEKR